MHHHKAEKPTGKEVFKLSEIVKLCAPLVEFIEIDRNRRLDEIYSVLDSGSRLNAIQQRLIDAYTSTGMEVRNDLRRHSRPKNMMVSELFVLQGEEFIDYLQLLLAAVAMKIVELPDEQLDAIEKMVEESRNDNEELFSDIMKDWKNSEVKVKKLVKSEHFQQEKTHHAHKPHAKHHTLFSRRHHDIDPIDEAKLNDPANGSNTYPRHGLSV